MKSRRRERSCASQARGAIGWRSTETERRFGWPDGSTLPVLKTSGVGQTIAAFLIGSAPGMPSGYAAISPFANSFALIRASRYKAPEPWSRKFWLRSIC